MPVTIFFCYARGDEDLLKKLKSHLRPRQRQGLIDIWYDRNISTDTEWEPEIKKQLDAAQIVLLLVSPDFMDSDYCNGIEMTRALERHTSGEALVIPIILRPTYWHGEPLGRLQALPTDDTPVTDPEWHHVDRALYAVTQGIHNVVVQLRTDHADVLPRVAEETRPQVATASSIPPVLQQKRNASQFRAPLAVEHLILLHTLTGHTDAVISVALTADGATLVSGSADHTIKVWGA